ncbi:MAG: Tm-1-like ATP-binding domain-containing protein [Deltaproteobacteria bacterium]|nr:Tm-1-like ATP-binding domain-containing protein [Deltaproteobacteria bacterium]
MVPGNTDFLVTGPLSLAEQRFPGRRLHVHNAAITVIATTPEEMKAIANRTAELCMMAKGPVSVLIPMGGFSAFDSPGGPLESPEIRDVFRQTIRAELPEGIECVESPHHINDPEFAEVILASIKRL